MPVVLGTSDLARMALAGIRLVNGVLALMIPGFLARQIHVDPERNPGIQYVFRMFGVRTVLVAFDLLAPPGPRRALALRWAIPIHASDTLAAWLVTRRAGPSHPGRLIVWISALNTVLAVVANRQGAR